MFKVGGIYEPKNKNEFPYTEFGHFGKIFIEVKSITKHGNVEYYILDQDFSRLIASAGNLNERDFVKVSARIKNKQGAKMGVLKRLSTFARKNFDKDTQNFIKLEWLDQDLEITEAGIAAAALHYLMTNKADMGKIAAEEIKEVEAEQE